MLNIPTDLLRPLSTVVDLSSFTKAAKALGITQPAVSAQIKRLQSLLGYDLLDKRAPGVILTPRGEFVVNQARRLLSINDDILRSTSGGRIFKTLRGGISRGFAGGRVPEKISRFRPPSPPIYFFVGSASSQRLLR